MEYENWHKDPNNWKYLFFYYNPQDKRIVVPKRSAWAGITFNYAQKSSWIWTFLLTLGVIGLIAFLANY